MDFGRFGKRCFDKNMAADVSAKKYAETSQANNVCRNVSYQKWHILCIHARPHRRKDQLQLRSIRDLRSR